MGLQSNAGFMRPFGGYTSRNRNRPTESRGIGKDQSGAVGMTGDEKYAATKKRNVQKATRRALRLIRKHHPATLLETSQLCLRLVYHGEGAFRKAYRIAGTKLLIKFPQTADRKTTSYGYTTDRCHTRSEVRKIKKLREFKSLRTHVPPVYYFNSRHGVMVTEFYP